MRDILEIFKTITGTIIECKETQNEETVQGGGFDGREIVANKKEDEQQEESKTPAVYQGGEMERDYWGTSSEGDDDDGGEKREENSEVGSVATFDTQNSEAKVPLFEENPVWKGKKTSKQFWTRTTTAVRLSTSKTLACLLKIPKCSGTT